MAQFPCPPHRPALPHSRRLFKLEALTPARHSQLPGPGEESSGSAHPGMKGPSVSAFPTDAISNWCVLNDANEGAMARTDSALPGSILRCVVGRRRL